MNKYNANAESNLEEINVTTDCLIAIDSKGNIQGTNSAVRKLFGYKEDDLVDEHINYLIPKKYNQFLQGYLNSYINNIESSLISASKNIIVRKKNGTTLEAELRLNDINLNQKRVYVISIHPLPEPQKEDAYSPSITETMRERYDRVIKASNTAVWEYYADRDMFFLDNQIFNLLGKTFDNLNLTLKGWRELSHPDDKGRIESYWQEYLRGGDRPKEVTYRVKHVSGAWRWFRETGNIISYEKTGRPNQVAGLIEDINEKKQEEEILNRLCSLATDIELSIEEKFSDVLALGTSFFELSVGIVSHIKNDQYTVGHSYPQNEFRDCREFKLKETYCSHVFPMKSVLSWTEAGESKIQNHHYYGKQPIGSYIGTTLFINHEPFGTLAFFNKETRGRPFTERENSIFRLISQWVSAELTREKNLRKVEESQNFLLLMQKSTPDIIFVKDEEFRIVQANQAFLNLYPEEVRHTVLGTTTLEAYDENEAELFLEQDKLALLQGSSQVEESIQFPDGKTRILDTKKIRFLDDEGNKYILGIGRDITRRKEAESLLEESTERYELAVKGSSVGLWDWNIQTGELFWSERFKSIAGISDGSFTPSHEDFISRLHPDDQNQVESAINNHLENKTPYDIEYRFRHDDNGYVWLHARGQAVWNDLGNATRMAGSIDDVTIRKSAESELMRSNMELERFAYLASHDLQEPLRMVANFTSLLERKYSDQLDDKAKEYIHFACDGASRMQILVKGLLEYARIGNEADTFKTIDLNTIKQTVEDNLYASIKETGATITWPNLPTIYADPPQIRSVFQNLIGNAIKYKSKDLAPKIDIHIEPEHSHWRFSITDNGIGMKQDYCEKIFDAFRRLHRKEEYPGTGIGLSICRKTIENLGGKIWATSSLGEGSTFYFTLPRLPNLLKETRHYDS